MKAKEASIFWFSMENKMAMLHRVFPKRVNDGIMSHDIRNCFANRIYMPLGQVFSVFHCLAPIAQLDRVPGFEPGG